ncbi:hypothetical protein nbrc107697_01640 [Gordonia crocea]|uniref:RDD domain-containing protein n=2 Tax=Gordonia crocea TaxID=589162 RepID=A0A7M3SU01_9ACTN|nr:hypothetical protein nbrc107697_01640 [Gordonia crocea]
MRPLPPPVAPSHSGTRGVGRDDFVSGEAVALDLPSANIGLRVLSGVLDVMVGWALFVLGLIGFSKLLEKVKLDEALANGLFTSWFVLVLIALPFVVETATRGKSLGHLALGLRTVNDDAGLITARQAFARALVGVVELYLLFGIPALITAAVSSKGKRLGDLIAGTYVIRDRRAAPPARHVAMPPTLSEWAATADLAPMPANLSNGIRGFLDRYASFTPQAQAVTGQQLMARALGYVSPAPPSTASPLEVLAAISAERYQRDAKRIARNQKLQEALFSSAR